MYRTLRDLNYYVNFYTVYLYERLGDSRDGSCRAGPGGLQRQRRWTDIASRIDQGLGYISVEEAAHLIRSLLNDPGRLKALSARAREVANGFSYERFKERLNEVIKELPGPKAKS
ncbi:MAG: hypothetical protein RQ853_03060 [Acidianus sp.]|jgi:hypothetical protein|nr:hypothetical protein [Acidianus sp.]